ncbi:MAG: DUF3662 and FHA domain-containing protein [Chloroflexota bacterium]
MGIFSRLEAFLERIFEAPAGRLGARLQPVLLTKRIERAMDSGKSFGAAGIIVPNRYDLHLHPTDFAAFEPYRGSLEDDLAHGAMARARRERYHLVARPTVTLVADHSVPRGDVRVAANVVDDTGDPIPDQVLPQPSSHTMVLARPGQEAAAPGDSAAHAFLLVRTDGAPQVRFDLGGAMISIGRASDNDVIVDDPEVSRHHCQLKRQHGAYSFADLGSRNGSWVNGQAVTEVALGPGDTIQIGSTEIEFQVGE